jgi:hypothetical protein
MAERDVRERDILVASNEFAYVQDLTKGDIVLYVGPTKISLSNTERLVEFKNERFTPVRGEEGVGVSPFVAASSWQYILLENPPKDLQARPVKGSNSAIELWNGRKVVVPGPAAFPLWPGQKARVIGGHELREDEYLVVRVYDRVEGEDSAIGTLRIVKGEATSFYIPKTGLEVVPTERGYVRRARRLRKNMGLHVRVVKPFIAAEDDQLPPGRYAAGQDLFLSDREGFFFPTESIEVVGEITPIPIAEKEGIYVRDLETGRIQTIAGPTNYLPDPTQVEIVSRPIDAATAELYGVSVDGPSGRALSIYIPPSFAVMVSAKSRREVVRGPQTRILAFDEDLEVLKLSTGRPKTDDELLSTCFLQVDGNKVSDVVRVKTADHVELQIALSYRVSFVGLHDEPEPRWFNVKNYVGLLCDHLASILRASARATAIERFHADSTEILRAAILGEKKGEERRVGRLFEENGMWVYDVEVLDVRILDGDVEQLLGRAQRAAIVSEVNRRQEELRLTDEKMKERVNREIYDAQLTTLAKAVELETAKRAVDLARMASSVEVEELQKIGRARNEAAATAITAEASAVAAERDAALEQRALEGRVAAFREQMAALQPELVSTLKLLGNQHLAAELSRNVSPLAILGGESVAEVLERLIGSLPLGSAGADGLRGVLSLAPPTSAGTAPNKG